MEDGDPSHGKKSGPVGRANQLRDENWIETLQHPAQSHDLNPKEGVWNVLKARVHRRQRRNKAELIKVIMEEFEGIEMEEVRSRIREMPWRCRMLVEIGGKRIKSALW